MSKDKKDQPMQFEDALSETGFGKFNYYIIVLCGLILTAVLFETLGLSFILPIAECDLNLTVEQKGIISSMVLAGIIITSHLWGFLADTIGRKKIILPTLIISFIFTFLTSFVPNFWSFLLFRFFTGFFISASSATVYAYLSEFHNSRNRSRAIMGSSVIFGCGCMFLPSLAWLVINHTWTFYIPIIDIYYKPWRLFLVICGLPSFISGIGLFFIPESPKFELLKGNEKKAIDIINKIQKYNSIYDKEIKVTKLIDESMTSFKLKEFKENSKSISAVFKLMWAQTAPLFKKDLLLKTIIACTLQFWIFVTSNGMYIWFPDILNKLAEYDDISDKNGFTICEILSKSKSNLITTNTSTPILITNCTQVLDISAYEYTFTVETLYAVGFAIIGLVINALGKLPILLIVFIGCGICGIGIVFVKIPMISIYLHIIMLACGLAVSLVNAATVDLYPTNLRAMAVCISLMMGRLGSICGNNVIAILLEINCSAAFWFSGISLIGCGFLSCFIPGIYKKNVKKSKENESSSYV